MRFSETKKAGVRAEQEVVSLLKRHTKFVYSNVRVDTLLTKSGDTEIDVIAAIGDCILVVEVKHIQAVEGGPFDNYWDMIGLSSGEHYKALSPLTQNRIHVRSLKDAWYAVRKEWPKIVSLVVVPDVCEITEGNRRAGMLHMSEFTEKLYSLSKTAPSPVYGYKLEFIFKQDDGHMHRSDLKGGAC